MRRQRCIDDYAQIALQGPKAAHIIAAVSDIDLGEMKPSPGWIRQWRVWKTFVAKTGYTGEDGVEFYRAERSGYLVEALETARKEHGIASCGLGARDTLRLKMKYALYGNDIDESTNPYEADWLGC